MSIRVLYVINDADFLVSHRSLLVREAARGYEVAVAAPNLGEEAKKALGAGHYFEFPLDRWSGNPFSEIPTLLALRRILRSYSPSIMHNITIKPVIYGTLCARLNRRIFVVNSIPGLGTAFSSATMSQWIRKGCVELLYRLAYSRGRIETIFQNDSDRQAFQRLGIVTPGSSHIIPGSGVDLEKFSVSPEPHTPVTIGLIGRLLEDKGVYEFCDVAERLHRRNSNLRFEIVGAPVKGHPRSVDPAVLQTRCASAGITWEGATDDVSAVMRRIHILCVPTKYNEGLPKVLLEAAASGRPSVASSMPGCRQFVRDGVNGLLYPVGDLDALESALWRLIEDSNLRIALGRRAREQIEIEGLSEAAIVDRILAVYERVQKL